MPGPFLRIEMLPAIQGDALWIEYGNANDMNRILIDGGPIGAYAALDGKLKTLPEGDKRVELLVITHVDTDHIEGIIRLLADKRNKWLIEPDDIWFNGWRHLKESEMLGGREGDFLSALISRRAFDEWNKAFNRKAVVVEPDKPLPVVVLKDRMKLTLLSPDPRSLQDMADKWAEKVEKFGLEPGDLDKAWEQLVDTTKYRVAEGVLGGTEDFGKSLAKQLKVDQSLANGTSIAFLAEFEGKSCLFLGDAHADFICQSLRRLIPAGQERLKVDAVKMSHHGSKANISEDLMKLVDARHFLVSTNGAIHNHPDKAAIEAVLQWSVQDPTLWFNYALQQNASWAKVPKEVKRSFTTRFPVDKAEGTVIEL